MQRWFMTGWVLFVVLLLAACGTQATGPQAQSNEVVVFAAASLTESFTQIGQDFEAANPGTTVVLNFANSQQLAQQLAQGAPADVFASANPRQMDVAIEEERVTEDVPQVFVNNRLVVVVPAESSTSVEALADLAQPGLKLVLAAEDTPIGDYSRDYLDKAAASGDFASGYRAALLDNVVSYEQTVKAVLTKVVLGEADAGIVYSSDVTPDVADAVQQITIPDDLNTIATYPIAPVSDSAQPALADAFVSYVLSPEGQDTLAGFGFIPINE
jgi:molybdate transport system substrate-binding protein